MKIWIVLPAYNEEKALPPLLRSLMENFDFEKWNYSIIVVNDGSSDQTAQVLESFVQENPQVLGFHNEKNSGLAETMKRGLLEAVKRAQDKDIIITMDADNTHPAGLALRMARLVREGNDVVVASRYQKGSRVIGVPFHRKVLSWGAALLFTLFFPIKGIRDYTCGYRAYRASVIKGLIARFKDEFVSEKGFSCMVDILLKLRSPTLIFNEVPLVLRYDLKPGLTKMNVTQTVFDTLKLLLVRRIFGVKGLSKAQSESPDTQSTQRL